MKLFRRIIQTVFLLCMVNIVQIDYLLTPLVEKKLFLYIPALLLFVLMECIPCYEKGLSLRLQLLAGGHELIVTSVYTLLIQIGILISLLYTNGLSELFLWNLGVGYGILLLHYLNGFWRAALYSSQLGFRLRVAMFFFWWLYPVNLFLMIKWCRIVRRELITARDRYLLDSARVENAICRTKYPVVMVHGICFRDWQLFNYWGRIPKALKRNGANVYYGKQQSALSVADSAVELKLEIERILAESGAEKVNIIAHSKGGLDSRYAISKLGLAPYVASLTTINTPHRGCKYADILLNRLPKGFINYIGRRYNSLFHILGDEQPDLLAGIRDLTASACEVFNKEVTDAPGIHYQSVASGMKRPKNTFPPLNYSYLYVKRHDGENDGLVSVSSAVWGNFLGEIYATQRRGLSHADVIDLLHRDIKGFDVCEFYVGLLADLKEQGF